MPITVGKIASLAIAIGYLIAAIVADLSAHHAITTDALKVGALLLIPLALIWFPDEIGDFTGYVGRGGDVDSPSPAVLISFMGWFFLVGLPCLFWCFRSFGS